MEITLRIGWPRHARAYGLILFLLLAQFSFFAPSFFGQAISAPGIGNTQEPGSQARPCSFTAYKDGTTYLVVIGTTGANAYSSTIASTVINNAIVDTANNGGGVVCLRQASYTITVTINLKAYVVLRGESRLSTVLDGGDTVNLITISGTAGTPISHAGIEYLSLDNGNIGITGSYFVNSHISHVDIRSSASHGINLDNSYGTTFYDLTSRNNGGRGIRMATAINAFSCIHCFAGSNTNNGIEIVGGATVNIIDADVERNVAYGVVLTSITGGQLSGHFEDNAAGNTVTDRNQLIINGPSNGFDIGPVYMTGNSSIERGVQIFACSFCSVGRGSYFIGHSTASIQIIAGSTDTIIYAFKSSDPTPYVQNSGTRTVYVGPGYENIGTVSFSSQTSKTANHGLLGTPTSILVTASATACGAVAITQTNSTGFTVTSATSCTATMYWKGYYWP